MGFARCSASCRTSRGSLLVEWRQIQLAWTHEAIVRATSLIHARAVANLMPDRGICITGFGFDPLARALLS